MTFQPCHRMLSATMHGQQRVEHVPAGDDRADKAGDDADRGHDVGHDVAGRRRPAPAISRAAGADQHAAPRRH